MAKLIAFYSRADENYFGGQYRYVKSRQHRKGCKNDFRPHRSRYV